MAVQLGLFFHGYLKKATGCLFRVNLTALSNIITFHTDSKTSQRDVKCPHESCVIVPSRQVPFGNSLSIFEVTMHCVDSNSAVNTKACLNTSDFMKGGTFSGKQWLK